ncbi:glycosyltransferase [bacterium]|nr:glycosyltransferase [bacterium]
MMPRIALVTGAWPPIKCGVGDFCRRLAVEMSHQGAPVAVVTDRGAQAQPGDAVTVHATVPHWGPSALPAVLRSVAAAGPDVVNLHYPTVNYHRLSLVDLLPLAVRTLLRLPVVTTVHEFSTFHRLGRRRVMQMVRSSAAAIVPDVENDRLLRQVFSARGEQIAHIPLGPPIEASLPVGFDRLAWRRKHNLDPHSLLLVYFGFVSPSKGLDTLLQAFAHLPTNLNIQLCLLADSEPSAPQYADYHRHIAAQVDRFAGHSIRWTGYLPADTVSAWLAAADLAVLPFADGASLRRTTLLTCIAHGLPVLSTGERAPIGGVDVVPIGDAAALARAISAFHTQPAKLAQLRRQAEDAAGQISWPSIAQETIDFLARVVK